MAERTKTYFIADSHLGQRVGDVRDREDRLVSRLREIRRPDTRALYLLGDIWDFWYEYRDVMPREGARVVSELIQLVSEGIEVYFLPGNHDIWCYSFFESVGIRKIGQPWFFETGGKTFCVGHGDALGGAPRGYRIMLGIFHCRFLQRLFSGLHPWLAYRFGINWSSSKRRARKKYHFRGAGEPLYRYACEVEASRRVDYFVFGHFHDRVELTLPGGARFYVLEDWLSGGRPCGVFDSSDSTFSLLK